MIRRAALALRCWFPHSRSRRERSRARVTSAPDRRHAGAARRDHRRRRRRGRPHDADHRQRQAGRRQGPVRTGVTVVHPRGQGEHRSGVRRVVHAERQRRDDRHHLDRGERLPRGADRDHQHAQRRRGARRDPAMAGARRPGLQPWWLPVVAETYDGCLNDINGFHVKPEHVLRGARRRARRAVPRKATSAAAPAWSATASRAASAPRRGSCRRAGRLHRRRARAVQLRRAARSAHRRRAGRRGDPGPAGVHRQHDPAAGAARPRCGDGRRAAPGRDEPEQGSIIVVVATDAPLLPHQLKRIATRASLGRRPAWAASAATARATSSSPSPPPTRARARRSAGDRCDDAAERADHAAVRRPPCRRRRKRSSTRCSPPRR